MSTLLKKPFIEEVVDGLDDASISSFQRFLDMGDGYSTSYQLRDGKLPMGANPSVERCTLLIDGPAQLCGVYAKYKKGNENRSAMVSFTTLESCTMYEIDEDRLTCRRVRERLSASELRRVLRERDIAKTENGSTVYGGGLEVKSNGDVTVGRNLEVEGTTKFNSGIEPIQTYNFRVGGRQYTLDIYEEKAWVDSDHWHNFFGLLYGRYGPISSEAKRYCVGSYFIDYNGDFSDLVVVSSWQSILTKEEFDVKNKTYGFYNFLSRKDISTLQKKLYRHVLTLNGKYWKEYVTDSNLKVDSIQDLDTITHAKNGTILVLDPELLLTKQDATWKIGAETVTTVSDEVYTL